MAGERVRAAEGAVAVGTLEAQARVVRLDVPGKVRGALDDGLADVALEVALGLAQEALLLVGQCYGDLVRRGLHDGSYLDRLGLEWLRDLLDWLVMEGEVGHQCRKVGDDPATGQWMLPRSPTATLHGRSLHAVLAGSRHVVLHVAPVLLLHRLELLERELGGGLLGSGDPGHLGVQELGPVLTTGVVPQDGSRWFRNLLGRAGLDMIRLRGGHINHELLEEVSTSLWSNSLLRGGCGGEGRLHC